MGLPHFYVRTQPRTGAAPQLARGDARTALDSGWGLERGMFEDFFLDAISGSSPSNFGWRHDFEQ